MSTKTTRKPLTRAEIQAAYRKRRAKEARELQQQMLALAFECGQRNPTATVSIKTLTAQVRQLAKIKAETRTSAKARRLIDLFYGSTARHSDADALSRPEQQQQNSPHHAARPQRDALQSSETSGADQPTIDGAH